MKQLNPDQSLRNRMEHWTKEEGNDFFQATDDGLLLSTGLNVILGERSSGKTFVLNNINIASGNCKFIEQFSLLQNDEEKFNEKNNSRVSIQTRNYLNEFKTVVEDVLMIDRKQDQIDLENYLSSLKKYASDNEKKDLFSKCKLYDEESCEIKDLSNLKKLIQSAQHLYDNAEFSNIISKHLSKKSLQDLILELVSNAISITITNNKNQWLNSLLSDVKRELRIKTTKTYVEEIDLSKILNNHFKIRKFTQVFYNLKETRIIHEERFGKFKVQITSEEIEGAKDLQKIGKVKKLYSSAFTLYNVGPYEYLEKLKELDIEEAELYRYFVKITSKTVNRDGFEVSGGERSEFNLIHEIQDANKYDILLIDEPESSFDNLFLKNEINSLIKDLSKNIPVVVVTHNSTVGASINPNYIAVTKKEFVSSEVKYKVYSGYPGNTVLVSADGSEIENYEALLNCLEAGRAAYYDRKEKTYGIYKDSE